MDFIKFSIEKPVSIIVGIILIVMFGVLALFELPYQLTPNVTEPEITVTTTWRGATPYEMEREIVEEQEKVLKGIPNLIEMESECFNAESRITLKFKIGTETNDALLRVSNKLNEVPEYPDNADRPIISATGSNTSPVIWMIIRTAADNPKSVVEYRTYFENEVKQYLERVDGVASLFMGGGVEEEMHIIVEPEALAAYNLTVPDLINTLQQENINVSAGNLGVGRRDYRIRTTGEFKNPEQIENTVILSSGQERIRVKDIGHVKAGYQKRQVAMLHNGVPGMAVGIRPEPGTNVLTLTANVKNVVEELNQGKLKEKGIYLDWVYDQVPYITGAIDLVKQNIIIGGLLAVVVLLIFLRSIRSTIIVAMAIPISIIGSFIIFNASGRTLNVVFHGRYQFRGGYACGQRHCCPRKYRPTPTNGENQPIWRHMTEPRKCGELFSHPP